MNRLCKWLAVSLGQLALGVTGCAHLSEGMQIGSIGSKPTDAKSRINIARIYERQGEAGKARQMYEDVLKRDRNSAEAHQRLAVIAAKQENFADAEKHFQAAIKIRPNDPQLLADYGFLQFTQNRLTAAEQVTRQALTNEPENKRAKNNLAQIVGAQGRYDEALSLFREVVPEANAHQNVAYLYSQAGDIANAQKHYSRALTLNAELKPSAQALVQLHQADQQQQRAKLAAGLKERSTAQQAVATKPVAPEVKPEIALSAEPVNDAAPAASREIPAIDNEFFTQRETTPAPVAAPPEQVAVAAAPLEQVAIVEQKPAAPLLEAAAPVNSGKLLPAETIPTVPADAPKVTPATASVAATIPTVQPAIPSIPANLTALCPGASGEVLNLVKQLENPEPLKRKSAVSRLGRMGQAAKPAVPACSVMLQDANPTVRVQAALALWRIEKQASQSVPALTASLRDEDPGIRSLAAAALGEIGPAAKASLPSLEQSLSDEDARIRIYVAEACCKIEKGHPSALKALVDSLGDGDSVVRELAIYALGNIAPESQLVVVSLTNCMADSESRVRAAAAFALGEIGPAAVESAPQLKKAQLDSHQEVRSAAQMALRRIDAKVVTAP